MKAFGNGKHKTGKASEQKSGEAGAPARSQPQVRSKQKEQNRLEREERETRPAEAANAGAAKKQSDNAETAKKQFDNTETAKKQFDDTQAAKKQPDNAETAKKQSDDFWRVWEDFFSGRKPIDLSRADPKTVDERLAKLVARATAGDEEKIAKIIADYQEKHGGDGGG